MHLYVFMHFGVGICPVQPEWHDRISSHACEHVMMLVQGFCVKPGAH